MVVMASEARAQGTRHESVTSDVSFCDSVDTLGNLLVGHCFYFLG
jgi:hypothetical protein